LGLSLWKKNLFFRERMLSRCMVVWLPTLGTLLKNRSCFSARSVLFSSFGDIYSNTNTRS
jgi:hypothetical protein